MTPEMILALTNTVKGGNFQGVIILGGWLSLAGNFPGGYSPLGSFLGVIDHGETDTETTIR